MRVVIRRTPPSTAMHMDKTVSCGEVCRFKEMRRRSSGALWLIIMYTYAIVGHMYFPEESVP
eukprot:6314941-Amphidinium_carterae.3